MPSAIGADPFPAPQAAVELRSVGVRYRVPSEPIRSFKEYVLKRLTRSLSYRDLWALRDVDLEIAAGEFFGIVGSNGAGKSTLLKVVSRILRPTRGRVVVCGRVAPLLELSAGFHPDLTGLENIVLNSGLLGYPRREVESEIQAVVSFAELDEFIHLPIRNYSSGMVARLGFSVATLFRPEILILDEVLAVGDPGFQDKSLRRIEQYCAAGTTILFVSHSLDQVARHCHRVAWVENGSVRGLGSPETVLPDYRAFLADPS